MFDPETSTLFSSSSVSKLQFDQCSIFSNADTLTLIVNVTAALNLDHRVLQFHNNNLQKSTLFQIHGIFYDPDPLSERVVLTFVDGSILDLDRKRNVMKFVKNGSIVPLQFERLKNGIDAEDSTQDLYILETESNLGPNPDVDPLKSLQISKMKKIRAKKNRMVQAFACRWNF